jgi:hypothetical protein
MMSHSSLTSALLFAAFSAGLAAQTGTGSAPSRATEPPRAGSITVAGCVQSADPAGAASGAAGGSASSGSSSDAAVARPDASSFVLANASIVRAAGKERDVTGTTGATGTAGSAGSATPARYALDGDGLASHLNQQVEVVGTISASGESAVSPSGPFGSGTASTAAPGNAGAPRAGTAAAAASVPRLRVQKVRVIADRCGQP